MARIKIDFRQPVPDQVAKSRDIQTKMSGNVHFPSPEPSLAIIATATDELEAAYIESLNYDRQKKALMRVKRATLNSLIVSLADYVQTTSGGNETVIISSGFGVRKTPTPSGIPAAPEAVKVRPATFDGKLDCVWKRSKGALTYLIEYSLTADFEKTEGTDIVTKARFEAQNLEAGVKYWFRVLAVNAAGKSPWSEPASGRTL